MHGNNIEPSLDRLLDQYEDIGGPEIYGPEGTAILLAVWRKSKKLGWKESFQMTNTELSFQTGIKSRATINLHRGKLAEDGVIEYIAPPRGSSRGEYSVLFNLIGDKKAVHKLNHLDSNYDEHVQNMNHFTTENAEPVHNLNHLADTVLKDLDLTITTTSTKPPIIQLIEAYCNLHKKIEFHLKDKERTLMFEMIGEGIPVSLIIETMQAVYKERSAETNITSFLYYKSVIYQAWETAKAITEGVLTSTVALGEDSITSRVPAPVVVIGTPRRTRPQQELDELRRKREEARRRDQG